MYKLAIEDIVEVPVKFTLKAGAVNKTFKFNLIMQRKTQEEVTTRLEECDFKFKEFLKTPGLVTDWEGQRLVLDDAKEPAPFEEATFDIMLGAQGVAQVIYNAYLRETGAKEKN